MLLTWTVGPWRALFAFSVDLGVVFSHRTAASVASPSENSERHADKENTKDASYFSFLYPLLAVPEDHQQLFSFFFFLFLFSPLRSRTNKQWGELECDEGGGGRGGGGSALEKK